MPGRFRVDAVFIAEPRGVLVLVGERLEGELYRGANIELPRPNPRAPMPLVYMIENANTPEGERTAISVRYSDLDTLQWVEREVKIGETLRFGVVWSREDR